MQNVNVVKSSFSQRIADQWQRLVAMGIGVLVLVLLYIELPAAHQHNMRWALGSVVFIAITSIGMGFIAEGVAYLTRMSVAERRKVFWGFTFAGPWIVGFVIFVVGPAGASLLYSFTSYDLGDKLIFWSGTHPGNYKDFWIELDNYRNLLVNTDIGRGADFKQALFNSFYYTLIGVPLQILAALGMALLLNRNLRGISVFRTIYYLPVILAASPAALLAWRYMFTSNGGFINNSLSRFAETFFVFDWIYRYSIYVIEGFNGFFEGTAAGQPIGAFKYTFPAGLGVLFFLTLIGEWNPVKRHRAYQIAEIMTILVVGSLLPQILRQPVDPSWTYVGAMLVTGLVILNTHQGKRGQARVWLVTGAVLFLISFYRTLAKGDFDFGNAHMTRYAIPLVIGLIASGIAAVGPWTRRKYQTIIALIAVMGVIVLIRAVPNQFGDSRWEPLVKYVTFGGTVNERLDDDVAVVETQVAGVLQQDDLSDRNKRGEISDYVNEKYDYWKGPYIQSFFSAYWIYGLVIAALLAVYLLDERYPQTRRYILLGSLAFFILFTFNTFMDGRAYFKGFTKLETAATVEGLTTSRDTSHYHFVTFRQRTDTVPTSQRVPQWLDNALWTKPSLVMITMWSSGASMLIFLAALKGVPSVLYEAAEVDGASTIQKFFKITLPMISPAMFYNIVIGVIAALQTFEAIYIIRDPSGKNDESLRSVAYFLYTRTFRELAIGEGAAASWILAGIILTLTVLQFRYSSWVNYEV